MSKNLSEAVQQLREELSSAEDKEALVRKLALDYGIHPELLRRKFVEATGRSPKEWPGLRSTRDFERMSARSRARNYVLREYFRLHADVEPGILFIFEGEEFAYVGSNSSRSNALIFRVACDSDEVVRMTDMMGRWVDFRNPDDYSLFVKLIRETAVE